MTDAELIDAMPVTQYLIMDTLAARWRLGEEFWTFPRKVMPMLRKLSDEGWVHWQGGVNQGTVVASLTHRGMKATLTPSYRFGKAWTDE